MDEGSATCAEDLWALVPDETLGRIAHLACRMLKAKVALISYFAREDQHVKSTAGLPNPRDAESLTTTAAPLNRQVIQRGEPLIIETDHAGAYIGAPIEYKPGEAIGALCVLDDRTRDWRADEIALMAELARACANELSLHVEAERRARAEAALARSQARLRAMTNIVPGIVFERRKTGPEAAQYTFVKYASFDPSNPEADNPAAYSEDSLAFIHADDRDRVREALRAATVEEHDVDLTFRAATTDGSTRWLRGAMTMRRDADGTAVWAGLCSDISDLIAARDAADAAKTAMESLLVDVNHELRAPLQAILGFTEFLKTETRPDIAAAHVRSIESAGAALLAIVNQLLDLAHGESGALPAVDPRSTDVRMLVAACQTMMAPFAPGKPVALRTSVDESVPPLVLADETKIGQVLVNLLGNALKFTEEGSVTLHVSYQGDRLCFSVMDTGIGIPEDKIELLFQRFSRIDPNRRSMRGTGLGLAIAKQLVERMGGTIGVKPNPTGGSTFWFVIEAQRAPAAVEPVVTPPEPREAAIQTKRRGARILVADDLDLNRQLISDMLSLEGYRIDCVADGAAALQAATETDYDLILMDMIMPGMDGLAATRAIRALPAPACNVSIIALTAHSFKEQLDSCLAAGMNATLTKPMSMEVLTSAVRGWMQGRPSRAA